MRNTIVLENIRSAYNVGNVIRTADALGWDVWLVGYTPSPDDSNKVKKTSLGAENNVNIKRFDQTQDMLNYARSHEMHIFSAEITPSAIPLDEIQKAPCSPLALIFGNEVDGVQNSTLDKVDKVVYIPMQGIKESLNIGQSTAIFMRALQQKNPAISQGLS